MADLFNTTEEYTAADKLACAQRELRFRKRVYADRVALGKMKPAMAEREIGIMQAIANDYARLADVEARGA